MLKFVTLFARLTFVAVVLSALTLAARADQKLTLRQYDVGNDCAFIKQYMDDQLRDYGRNFKPWKVWVGRADITKDGKPELFVYFGDIAFCGSVGCETHIFRKIAGKWMLFAPLHVSGVNSDLSSERSLFLRDDGGPYLTIYSYYYGLRWSDKYKDYVSICMRPCPDG